MSASTRRPVALAAAGGLIVGILGTSLAFGLRTPSGPESATPVNSVADASVSESASQVETQGPAVQDPTLPSDVSSAGPPPPPPPQSQATTLPFPQPATFSCSVQLKRGPGEGLSTLLVVEAPAEISTVWGMITSGEQRTGGAVTLVGGRGEQVVVGFDARESQAVMYADPSMNPASEACRTQ